MPTVGVTRPEWLLILVSGKRELKTKCITGNKEKYHVTINGLINHMEVCDKVRNKQFHKHGWRF